MIATHCGGWITTPRNTNDNNTVMSGAVLAIGATIPIRLTRSPCVNARVADTRLIQAPVVVQHRWPIAELSQRG